MFTDCFNCLPVAALIDEKILCMHGGLSPDLNNLNQIRRLPRPTDVPEKGLLCDLLWSDPGKDIQGWGPNDRGVSYSFGPDRVTDFLKRLDLDLICRAHQVWHYFEKTKKLILESIISNSKWSTFTCKIHSPSLLACQVVEDGYEFFANKQLVTIFSAPNYCGEFDNAGAVMTVDENLMCSFQILSPADKKQKGFSIGGNATAKSTAFPNKVMVGAIL